jgi:hypothetical protein
MSAGWLFAMGVLVTAIVAAGLALPLYGAILDGRDEAQRRHEAERKAAEVHDLSSNRFGRPAA